MDSIRFTEARSAITLAFEEAGAVREELNHLVDLVDELEDAMCELQVAKKRVWDLAEQIEGKLNAGA